MAFKIYTKTGDKGTTSLYGGVKLPKNHIRIEAYGTVDELNSFVGLLKDQLPFEPITKVLLKVQDRLFVMGSNLAATPDKLKDLPQLADADIQMLENEIDSMDEALEPLKTFILPGGHVAISTAHVCRTVCRRAERRIVHLMNEDETDIRLLVFLNRLSDYFFTLARYLAVKLHVKEIPWIPSYEN